MVRASRRLAAALFVGALGGCTAEPRYPIEPGGSSGSGGFRVEEPRYPTRETPARTPTAPPPRRPPPPSEEDAPRAAPSGSVESRPLPAPGPSASAAPAFEERRLELGPPPPPEAAAPRRGEVQVQPFETLYDVAERAKVPVRSLVALNDLKPPYALSAGQILKAPAPLLYQVVEGDTLYGVARRFAVDPRSLAGLNDVPLEERLSAGRRLYLPALVQDHGPGPGAGGVRPAGAQRSLAADALRPSERAAEGSARLPPEVRPAAPAPSEADVASLSRGRFVWPLRGEVLSAFGPKGPGQRNDGINIAAEAGQSVRASASGVVVYVGDSIPAFGNLVLVKHPGGWATLYGNLGRVSVAANAAVSQGQEVGTVGLSGAVDRPQLHFEIRYAQDPRSKAKPYDPAVLLPSG